MEKLKNKTNESLLSDLLKQANKSQIYTIEQVSKTLSDLKMGDECFLSAVLYVIKDKSTIDYKVIEEKYPKDTAFLLEKLNSINFFTNYSDKEEEKESIRNMILTMAKDIRVMIILLCFVLYKVENIDLIESSAEKTEFMQSVRDIFAPLSARLGLNEIKNKLEDETFKFLEPVMYKELVNNKYLNSADLQLQVDKTIKELKEIVAELHINAKIYGRQKHLSSIYKKMQTKKLPLAKIYDLVAVRVIVETVEECYLVLGKINSKFTILPYRFKDYIAVPKINGYRSIHTGILAENNRPVEIQIRTREMHEFNEYGVAAHWIYKSRGVTKKRNEIDEKINWLKQIIENSKDLSTDEFLDTIKMDMFGSEIYCQTPNGKVIKFPSGANCIDFAYAIHSDIGNRMIGAKINGKMVPIKTELQSGDICEIIVGSPDKAPSRDWLNIVKTSQARSKINAYFKKFYVEDNIKRGRTMLDKAIKDRGLTLALDDEKSYEKVLKRYHFSSILEMFASIGHGSLAIDKVLGGITKPKTESIKTVKNTKSSGQNILVHGLSGVATKVAKCCLPVYGDKIIGYSTLTKGITVHRQDCENVPFLDKSKFVEVSWAEGPNSTNYISKIEVEIDSNITMSKLSSILEEDDVIILALDIVKSTPIYKEILVKLQVKNSEKLSKIISKLNSYKFIKAKRAL